MKAPRQAISISVVSASAPMVNTSLLVPKISRSEYVTVFIPSKGLSDVVLVHRSGTSQVAQSVTYTRDTNKKSISSTTLKMGG